MDNQIFVKIEEYQEVLDIVNNVKDKIDKTNKTIDKINELKKAEDSELDIWQNNVKQVSKNIEEIEKILSQTKQG